MADRFLADSAERHRKKIAGIDATAFALLTAYDWPGNIRQLRNEIERAVALTPQGGTIRAEAFSREIAAPGRTSVAQLHENRDTAATASPVASRADEETASPSAATQSSNGTTEADLRSARTAFESRFIAEQLRANGGNVSRTAEALGISRVMLQKKMKEYGLR